MAYSYTKQNLQGLEKRLQRFFEILPGLTSWTILLGLLGLSFWRPLTACVIIIAFDLYWLFRLFYVTLFLVLSYGKLAAERKTDWMGRLQGLQRAEIPSWKEIHHLVIFPVVKEGLEVIEPSVKGLAEQDFPSKQMIVVIALEERAADVIKKGVDEVSRKYKDAFFDFLVIRHPDGLPGEARVKGANVTYAAKQAAQYLTSKGIDFEKAVVSCFDADTVVSPAYFSCLTYHFLVHPDRTRASFQPIPVYHNNIWEAPGFARVLEMGSSFFQLTEATNPEKLVTFSSHSMSFKALVDVGYWPVDIISDDSAIFWKSYIHFEGKYWVVPMYVTLSMDVVNADSFWKTVQGVYKQKRRWAWGVENFPLVMRGFLKSRHISFYDKVRHGFKMFEGHVAWASWAFILTFIGWLPAVFASREFSNTVLYYSAPRITVIIFNLALLSLFVTIVLSLLLLPREKPKNPLLRRVVFAFEWLTIPLVATFLSALPALDAQTRLALGRYMEFWVTEKKR